MSNILLIHNSDVLYDTLKPADENRPLFYWYTDRFASHVGTMKYLYFCLINPKKDRVALRARGGNSGFDTLHKDFLYYKEYCEGSTELNYAEPGIAMSFDEIKPTLILKAIPRMFGNLTSQPFVYEVVSPHDGQSRERIKLFEKSPKTKAFLPIKFTDIPLLVKAAPQITQCLPSIDIKPNVQGNYRYRDWLPMVTEKSGTWI